MLEFGSGVAAIGEGMAQRREAPDDFSQHQRRAVMIFYVGRVDFGMDEMPLGIGKDVTPAPLGLRDRVIAARPATLPGFYALAVDHASTG